MDIELDTSTLSLPRDGLVAVRDAEGTRITCISGALWITEDAREGDVILQAGETFTIDRRGLTLIMGLTPASLHLSETSKRAGGWLSRVLPAAGRLSRNRRLRLPVTAGTAAVSHRSGV